MKKFIIAGGVVLLFVLYAIRGQFQAKSDTTVATTDTTQTDTNSSSNETTNPNDGGLPTPTPNPTPIPAPTPNPTPIQGQYKNGSFNGKVEDAFYGPLQVKAVISGGKIVDVVFLQYPNDRDESVQVNSVSSPRLRAEAIQAQSANVDIVSGATQSSEAFQKSLADALAQAK